MPYLGYPDFASAYYNRGHAHLDRGDLAFAVSDFERASDLYIDDADRARALSWSGCAYRMMHDWDSAERVHTAARALDTLRHYDHLGLADIARHRGDTEAWQTHLAEVEKRLADASYYNLACFHSIAGDMNQAIDRLAQALSEDPSYRAWAAVDPDLCWNRDDPRFQQLIALPTD